MNTTMNRRDCVTFSARSFPDDAQWDEQGNLLVPGGRCIAEAIRTRLNEQGVTCADIYQHSFYGWSFDLMYGSANVAILIAAAEDRWLLQILRIRSLIGRIFGSSKDAGIAKIQDELHRALASDRRLSDILWYTKREYDACGEGRCLPRE